MSVIYLCLLIFECNEFYGWYLEPITFELCLSISLLTLVFWVKEPPYQELWYLSYNQLVYRLNSLLLLAVPASVALAIDSSINKAQKKARLWRI